jgi:methylenetetrahydrofolate dehydrogenase (NADP+)/methenyltetrahydrofolate cyclohydrolase
MLLNAQDYVNERLEILRKRVSKLKQTPKLAIIRVGDDYASGKYVQNKVKRCKEVGMHSEILHFEENVTQAELIRTIFDLNRDRSVTGVLLQLPLPKHLDENHLTSLIHYDKDVDGFNEINMGKLVLGEEGNVACTPRGIISLLRYNNIEMEGKDVLIINRSNIVGKPLAHLFLKENATVTIAHSKTKDLHKKIKKADIVVTGVGIPNFLTYKNFKKGTTIVDVAINFDENNKMCGDVRKTDYNKLVKRKCNITPVPGGVGQMTVLELIEQTIEIAERKM